MTSLRLKESCNTKRIVRKAYMVVHHLKLHNHSPILQVYQRKKMRKALHWPNNQSSHLSLLSTQRTIAIMRCSRSTRKLLVWTAASQKKIWRWRPTKKTSDNWWASERTSLSYLIHQMKMTKIMKANREDIKNLSSISKMRTELWTHLKLSWKASLL